VLKRFLLHNQKPCIAFVFVMFECFTFNNFIISLGATPPGEESAIYPVPCRETYEGAVHITEVYFVGMGPKGPAL
jgi:hypothetical protein